MHPDFVALLRPFLRFAGEQPITEESRLRELGLDSMQAIEVLFALEDGFGVTLPDEALSEATFETAGSLWEVVAGLLDPSLETSR
jgi:acyl carrier protein